MSNEFSLSVGQAHEIEQAMNRAGEWNGSLVKRLCGGDNFVTIREFLLGQLELRPTEQLVDLDADPLVPEGWEVAEHKKGGQFKFDPTKVKLYLSKKQKTGVVVGHDLRKEIEPLNPFNVNLLDWYLKPENQRFIPEDWKKLNGVFFWGTIYRARDGDLYIRYLYWYGAWWYANWRWLDNGWSVGNPALVPASV